MLGELLMETRDHLRGIEDVVILDSEPVSEPEPEPEPK
eukprot:SAG11_NODE_13878_length_635_cov_0.742537_1_plen_37_part_10